MSPLKWVTPRLAVSGRQPLSAQEQLRQAGITCIINLTIKPDPKWAIQHFDDGEPDDGLPKPPQWFHRGIEIAKHVMANGKLLVHCESGVNRGPSMAYAILLSQGMSPQDARLQVLHSCHISNIRYQADAERAVNG